MIIDHIGFGVSDYERAKDFYGKVLAPLGITLVMEVPPDQNPAGAPACGFGRGKPDFWIGGEGKTSPRMHIAFTARKAARRCGPSTIPRWPRAPPTMARRA